MKDTYTYEPKPDEFFVTDRTVDLMVRRSRDKVTLTGVVEAEPFIWKRGETLMEAVAVLMEPQVVETATHGLVFRTTTGRLFLIHVTGEEEALMVELCASVTGALTLKAEWLYSMRGEPGLLAHVARRVSWDDDGDQTG